MSTRNELLNQLDTAYRDYLSAIDGLGEPEFEKKWLDGNWGALEITAHIT